MLLESGCVLHRLVMSSFNSTEPRLQYHAKRLPHSEQAVYSTVSTSAELVPLVGAVTPAVNASTDAQAGAHVSTIAYLNSPSLYYR